MNVTDFEDVETPDGDLLEGLFEGQRKLMEKYHPIESDRGFLVVDPSEFGNVDHRFVQERIKNLAYRAIEELTEATNTLKNRPHKTSEVNTDKVHFWEELGDFMHYALEVFITAGLDAKTLAKIYHQKHAVNKFRIGSGY